MKREDVIKLAGDAGFTLHTPIEHINKFKRLIELATEKAVAEERERSAKVAQQYSCQVGDDAWNIATAIRARKENT